MVRKLSCSRELKLALFGLFVFIVAIAIAIFFKQLVSLKSLIGEINLDELREYIASFGIIAPLILFFTQSLQAIIPILPGSLITIAGGLLFGELKGAVISYFGALFGAVVVFYISKYFGRGFVEWLFHKQDLGTYDKLFKQNGFIVTFLLRAIPFVDFGFASYLIGISSISFKEYFFGTALGLIPTVLIYSYYGSALLSDPIIFSVLGLLFLLFFLFTPYLMKYFTKGKS